jgi:hypothetical protein
VKVTAINRSKQSGKKNGAAKIIFAVVSFQSQETREVAFQ